jgi:hypothetical protein
MILLTLSSSDLLRYDGGALGLMKYKDGSTGESTIFFGLEDPALEAARNAAVSAFVVGILYLFVLAMHNCVSRIPGGDILLSILGAVIQLCLLAVYVAKDNGICEVEGCSWGRGATWLIMSQIIMISASIGSICTSDNSWIASKVGLLEFAHTLRINPHRREL